jgi:PAS domain S-box-containing protein
MARVDDISDPHELRRLVHDLVALSTLPGIWKTHDPAQISDSVADALVSMFHADFVHIALPGTRIQDAVEVTRTAEPMPAGAREQIRAALHTRAISLERPVTIADPLGSGDLVVASAPIGLGRDSILAVGARRPAFPTRSQLILLATAATEVRIAFERSQFEAEQRRFAAMIDSSSDFIGFTDLEGSPQYLNPAGLKLSGLHTIEEASRLHILDFIAAEQRSRAREQLWPLVMRTGRWIGELNFQNLTTGETIPFLVDWFRIDNPRTAQPMNFGTVSRNLSAQKKSEAQLLRLNELLEHRVLDRTRELEDANETLVAEIQERARADARVQQLQIELYHAARLSTAGQLAATLAHELSQPLTATLNSVNAARRLISKPDIDARVADALEEAARQALRASHIMRRMGDFVRRGRAVRRSESILRIIENAGTLAVTGPDSLGVKVQFHFDPRVEYVLADRIQIEQVLVNLMRNALEAMVGSWRRELVVSTALIDEETVEISVADTGPGISKEINDQLFEPFVSSKCNGMGLGLSICRSVVESHGGTLLASTPSQGGAVFRFTLAIAPNNGTNDVD